MAVPLIVSVTPASGPTGGRNLVRLKTNNARLPPDPPATGFVGGTFLRTVRVEFGGIEATDVRVFGQGSVTCLAPIHDPGTFDVVLTNLDDNGDPIPGEVATKVDAYRFRRPNLTAQDDLTRLVRTFIQELRRQVIDEVSLTVSTDFDDSTEDFLNIARIAKLPALVLVGPDINENRFFSTNEKQQIELPDGTVEIRRSPYTVDLLFECIGIADLKAQILNLMAAFTKFINRNKFLEMDRDPADPSLGKVRYEMDFTEEGGEPSSTDRLNDSNVRSFAGNIIIRGFDLEDLAGVSDDLVTELSRVTETDGIIIQPPENTNC